MKKSIKIILIIVVLIVLLVGGYFGYQKYQKYLEEERINKLRYHFLMSLNNSPEKSIVVKHYLENKLAENDKKNIKEEEYIFIKKLLKEVEKTYLKNLKDLTLNEKRNFFSRDFNHLLYKNNEQFNKSISI